MRHKYVQALTIEMFKAKQKLCPEITEDVFVERTDNQFNLRNCTDFISK